MPTSDGDYRKIYSELIKKQILILGPDITLAKVKNVPGITIDAAGTVTKIEGDPQVILQNLINQFVELSGMIVKKTMESILSSYPNLAGLATTEVSTVQPPVQPQVQPQTPPQIPHAEPPPPVQNSTHSAPQPVSNVPPTTSSEQPSGAGNKELSSMDQLSSEEIERLNQMIKEINQMPENGDKNE